MQNGRHRESWLRPCDLCGSMHYETLAEGGATLYRCRECGLVQRAADSEQPWGEISLDEGLFDAALRQVMRRTEGVAHPSVLILGRPSSSALHQVRLSRLSVTLLVDHNETAGLEGLVHHVGRIENAPFLPEQFDVILCARGVESLDSAATLFAKARLWLAPEGLLFVGGANWGSLSRRLWPQRWREYHRAGRIFVDHRHLKDYAARHGFERISSGTRTHIEEVAAIVFSIPSPSFITNAAALPLWLASSLPGLGETWWSLLSKRGYAARPILRRLDEETERAPGLAAAGYGSASRELIEAER